MHQQSTSDEKTIGKAEVSIRITFWHRVPKSNDTMRRCLGGGETVGK